MATENGQNEDRGESIGLIEPLLVSEGSRHRSKLADLAITLSEKSASLRSSLPPKIVDALATVVRSMNCYYSNLIEGHDTHPIEIEKALNEDFSADPKQRDLQLEARAHISVQEWIDQGGLDGRATTQEGVVETHRRFCELLPDEMLWIDNPDTGGVWSIARGLAKNVESYKAHLNNCDQQRRNDLDGRGNLSEESLAEFKEFFLNICIDQVDFMEELMQPRKLRARAKVWCEEEISSGDLPAKSDRVIGALIDRGELGRAEVPELLGLSERSSQRITRALLDKGVIKARSTRAPFELAFPAALSARWLPGLFPEK